MKKERSAGVVIFRKEGKVLKFLLLHYKFKSVYWDFPKGHIEQGETELQAAKREVYEETGIRELNFLLGFRTESRYFFRNNNQLVEKTVVYFLAQTTQKEVKISYEHIGYGWFSYEEAMKLLKPESQKVLKKAMEFLVKTGLV